MVKIKDEELLKLLEENARASFVELARELGVTEGAVRKRIKKLVELGVIRKFTVELDPKKLGYKQVAIIGVDTRPEKLIDVVAMLKENEKVKRLATTAGDHMILFEAWFRNHKELEDFIRWLNEIEGVVKVCPAIVLERIK